MENKLKVGNLTINKPEIWNPNNVVFEIQDYDYESTTITIEQLEEIYNYIGKILNK
jgi:hypothetical protein